jgi:uncharacterized protein (TIGR00661 family)
MSKPNLLYAINGTGLGHISRAKVLIPQLKKKANIDILISGTRTDLVFKEFIKYTFQGFTFVYKKGGINWPRTLKNIKIIQFIKDVYSLNLNKYDLIISDFEPISAWASILRKKRCINVSHQAAFYSLKTPRPKFWPFYLPEEFFMKNFARTKDHIGIHFKKYDKNIMPPLIKDEIIKAKTKCLPHITIYLSAISLRKQIIFFQLFPNYNFEIFHSESTKKKTLNNLKLSPLCEDFKLSLINSSGYISQAGFESNSEALYLQKPIICIPIRHQYEQKCNAEALKKLGVTVLTKLKFKPIKKWLETKKKSPKITITNTKTLVDKIIDKL